MGKSKKKKSAASKYAKYLYLAFSVLVVVMAFLPFVISKSDNSSDVTYTGFEVAFGKTLNSIIDGIFNFRNSIVATLKKMYNWTRMKASIYVTRNRRVGRISNEIKQISKEYITICHPEMPVEKSKIANLFEGSILELREQYTKKEAEMIANAIVASEKKQVIFNQYADGWDMLISSLKKQKATIKIKIIINIYFFILFFSNS